MNKTAIILFFGGTAQAAAKALEVTKQAVNGWGEVVPEGIAYKAQVLSNNRLVVDPQVYRRLKKKRLAAA